MRNAPSQPVMNHLVGLFRELNARNLRYIVVGGIAINIHGFIQNTENIDLLIETGELNEGKLLDVLALLPDRAAKELKPEEVGEFVVVRVCDEITVDLTVKA